MSALEITRHALCLTGRVSDALTGLPLAGAGVRIAGGPPAFAARQAIRAGAGAPDRALAVTGNDGSFGYRDLPDGTYAVAAAAAAGAGRYAEATASATVARDAAGTVALGRADIALAPTAIAGIVTAAANGRPVPLATVTLAGGDDNAVTDAAGAYRLVAVEPGARTLVITATGFAPRVAGVTAAVGRTAGAPAADIALAAA